MKQTNLQKWFETFFSEKALDSKTYKVNSANGTFNMIPTECVIEGIMATDKNEQAQIKDVLVKIDFMNGNVHHFLEHLAGALAQDM